MNSQEYQNKKAILFPQRCKKGFGCENFLLGADSRSLRKLANIISVKPFHKVLRKAVVLCYYMRMYHHINSIVRMGNGAFSNLLFDVHWGNGEGHSKR